MYEWREIPGFEDYMVNEIGELYSRATDSYPLGTVRSGRRQFNLRKGPVHLSTSRKHTLYSHQLVAMAFHNVDLKPRQRIKHKDGNLLNNHWSNLDILSS